MARFIPPDAAEAHWMIQSDTALPYLLFMTNIYEVLCLYSPSHGLPQGIRIRETQEQYEKRLVALISDFVPIPASAGSEVPSRLKQDVEANKKKALDLYYQARSIPATVPEVDEFLNTLLDTYAFLTIAGRRRRP